MRGTRPAAVLTLVAVAGAGLLQGASPQAPAPNSPPARSTIDGIDTRTLHVLLDAYETGDSATFDEHAGVFSRALPDVVPLQAELATWIADAPAKTDRRTLIAASVALELALVSRFTPRAPQLVEIGCAILQQQPASHLERAWHIAATDLAPVHAAHARARMPDFAAPRLPAAVDLEKRGAPAVESLFGAGPSLVWLGDADIERLAAAGPREIRSVPSRSRMDRADAERLLALAPDLRREATPRGAPGADPNGILMSLRLWDVADAFREIVEREPTLAEAHLRLGQSYVRLARPREALLSLRAAEETATTPYVRYLARLLSGGLLERLGRRPEAMQAFRGALEVVPGAQSATLALAPLLFIEGDRDEASALMRAALRTPLVADPIDAYWNRDPGRWTQYIAALRQALR